MLPNITSSLQPGNCGIHGYHGRTACPQCSTSTLPFTPLIQSPIVNGPPVSAAVSPADTRTPAMRMRGTPADAPKVRRLLDEVAVRVPQSDLGHALYEWAEEVTRLVEGL